METLYFAYGSNMSRKRMIERLCNFSSIQKGHIKDYALIFNKTSTIQPESSFANIKKQSNSVVEGVLYSLDDSKLNLLDRYEGVPRDYERSQLNIHTDDGVYTAWVYIAKSDRTGEGKPTQKYIDFLLEGKEFLSDSYVEYIKSVPTL